MAFAAKKYVSALCDFDAKLFVSIVLLKILSQLQKLMLEIHPFLASFRQ